MEIRKVGVVGAGFMGSGIAQVAAQAGYAVRLIDAREEVLPGARRAMEDSLAKLHAKGHVAEPPGVVLDRVTCGVALDALADVDLVFEAVFETVADKHSVFKTIESVCRPDAVIASNTSAIPITTLAEALRHKARLVGTHFFSPVPVNPLLEIIPGRHTSADTLETAQRVGDRLGKSVVVVKRDVPGFIMNRLFGAMACEAMRLVEQGVGGVEDVDRGMTSGYGMTLGPLAIADLAGLDICLHAFTNIHTLDKGALAAPPELLRRLVREGKLGRKTGEGFYRYDTHGKTLGPAL